MGSSRGPWSRAYVREEAIFLPCCSLGDKYRNHEVHKEQGHSTTKPLRSRDFLIILNTLISAPHVPETVPRVLHGLTHLTLNHNPIRWVIVSRPWLTGKETHAIDAK